MLGLSYGQRLQNLISQTIYAFYHSRWMPGRAEINRVRSWAMEERAEFSKQPPEIRTRSMFEALRIQIAYCRKFVPYYRNILQKMPAEFPRNFAEYRQFPILTKEIIRQAGDALLSEEFSKQSLRRHVTGGSTGEPVTVYMTLAEDGIGGYDFFMRQNGVEAGKRMATLYGGELDIIASPRPSRRVKDWLLNMNNHGCFRLDDGYLLDVHHEFESFQPDLLVGYASAIYLLARTLAKNNIQPSYPAKLIITAAEKLEQYQRKVIQGVFSTPVIERYGSRDAGTIGEQHPNDHRIWLDSWDYLIEPETVPDENHQASLLISRLHTRAMPLLRYQIGDLGLFPPHWQPEQPPFYLGEVNGRILDLISLPNGGVVHGSEFPHLFKDFDVILYQVVQEDSGDVCVSILPGERFDQYQKSLCERIIAENLPGIKLAFQYPMSLERTSQNKLRPVISRYAPN